MAEGVEIVNPGAVMGVREKVPPAGTALPVTALTAGMARGDEEAFRRFHALYFGRLLRYHLVLARGDEAAAGEALQETLLRVVRHARRFEAEDVFWSWLTVLSRSAAADGGRKKQRYWRLLAEYARGIFAKPEPGAGENEQDQLEAVMIESLDEMSGEARELIEGKYFCRASVRALASATGLTEKAVESRLLRARRELREKMLRKLSDEKRR